MSQNNKAFIK